MKHNLSNHLGKKYNNLTIVSKSEIVGNGQMVKVKCDCGIETDMQLAPIIGGRTKSCGCRLKSINGLSTHNLYYVWRGIQNRCYNKSHKEYKYYGQKGIKMCEEWKDGFLKFYNWSIENGWQKGMHIDRIKNHLNYTPDNCRFISQKMSANNKTNNRIFTIEGNQYTLAQISEKYNIEYKFLHNRLQKGWEIEKAINIPFVTKTNSIKVICLNTNKIYNSISEAANELNVTITKIWNICNGKTKKMRNGYMFKYLEEKVKHFAEIKYSFGYIN